MGRAVEALIAATDAGERQIDPRFFVYYWIDGDAGPPSSGRGPWGRPAATTSGLGSAPITSEVRFVSGNYACHCRMPGPEEGGLIARM